MDLKLDYFPDLQRGKEALVEIDIKLTEVGKWNKYLIGHFLDGQMPYPLLVSTARNQLKDLFVAIKPNVAGFFLFEFRDEQAKMQVLEGGPYFFSQKYLVLKDWHRMMKPAQDQPSKIPAWVKLHDLPFELWNQECLSRVASTIGKPLHVDQATTKTAKQAGLLHTKSTKARICIEVSAEQALPDEVTVIVAGESVVVSVEYQVLPPKCDIYHVFGHHTIKCASKPSTSPIPPQPSVQALTVTPVGKENHRVDCDHPKESSSSPPDTRSIREELSDSEDELLEVLEGVVSSNQEEGVLNQSIKTATSLAKVQSELKPSLATEPPDRLDPGVSKVAADLVSKGSASFNKLLSKSAKKHLKKQAKEESIVSASKEVKSFVSSNKLNLVGFIEHKIRAIWADRITQYICPDWSFVNNYSQSALGRIFVGWDPSVFSLTVLGQFDQCIHCEVQPKYGSALFLVTMVYGANSNLDRRSLWHCLTQFRTSSPWVVLGDFNAIRHPREKVGVIPQWSPHMDDINHCLFAFELDDLRFTGCLFTWSNKQVPPQFVASKLDRVLVNEPWMKTFTQSSTHFLVPGISDHSLVVRVWRSIVIGNPMFCVCEKLKHLQHELKQLNKAEFSGISERVCAIRQDLENIQAIIGSHPNNSSALAQERVIKAEFVNFYTTLFDLEIKETFWSLNPAKAPGPDGYNAGFFRKAWSVIGNEITSAVQNFFRSRQLLTKANFTIVALVPKVQNPSKVGDFRPISCCNTIYKCISRILAKRLQSVLSLLIDLVQSGFVKGRRIADNIFLTQELMRGYHKSSPSPRCAMKVDIMKAYDHVRWEFLWDVLFAMNFHPTMIKWLQACVTTTNYSLCINGEVTGNIKGRKGLRQGDPLSSYLFVIVMEVLTTLLKKKSHLPDFHFHWRCKDNQLINLCFADDLMIFCKGELPSIKYIRNALAEFEDLSGLSPSPGKSSVFFSGVSVRVKETILQELGFQEGSLPVRYLGVPLLSTKLKAIDCQRLVDSITTKTKCWTNRDLTYAGRVQLIKKHFVLNANILVFPVHITKKGH
ncbi:uncharacterized protein LOC131328462 [Rhododendron vialii]|uniref:uncharacterized protein LOC131328462 n=1 Tax=Rhododendron vialii TaxID=182163 RepID=UPI00266033D5|nr:uncharacterized protein LOC131328462 [Rhododendron vialii]